jgi:hypothetical protein
VKKLCTIVTENSVFLFTDSSVLLFTDYSISVLFIFAVIFVSCQTKTKVMPVDINESKKAVTRVLNEHWSAVRAKDADAVIALVTDDFLSCGSDPEEFWDKTDM